MLWLIISSFSQKPEIKDSDIASPILNETFMEKLKELEIEFSLHPQDRLFRAHG